MKPIVSVALAACLLAFAFGPAQAQTATPCARPHTVAAGENLYRIGLAYGVTWPAIATANNLANPNLIFVGQVLCVPPGGATAIPATGTAPAPATPAGTATRTPTPGGRTATPRPATPAPTIAPTPAPTAAATAVPGSVPTVSVTKVVRDTSVTIVTANFPPNQTFTVLMGQIGTLGVNGVPAGTLASGTGGALTGTFTIPAQLAGAPAIAIRLQSPAGYYSYNWFYNATFP